MSYIVLARKYRPQTFKDVIGQSHITETLTQAVSSLRLAHAYLFCGPRGIGKTSCARILAKSLNCQKGPTTTPCGKCPACVEISGGNSFDVIEIDGASNRGIDEVRTLRENVKFAPSYGRYKVYIIDEVHMLTTEAFNALLKTLEEPPDYVKFILATTEPHKIPATIISRCQRFDFKRISVKGIVKQLTEVAAAEKLKVEESALFDIAKAAMGSLRDALSILDQLSALSSKLITSEDVVTMLGLVETEFLFALAEAVSDKDCSRALDTLDKVLDAGKDIKQLAKDLIEHFRHLMVFKINAKGLSDLVDHPVAVKERLDAQARKFALKDLLHAIDVLIAAHDAARVMDSLRLPLEIALAKLTVPVGINGPSAEARASSPPNTLRTREPAKNILANQKGHMDFSPAVASVTPPAKDLRADVQAGHDDAAGVLGVDSNAMPAVLDMEAVRKGWDTLTFAVSRKKMSIATYLQEGSPYEVTATKLVVGFPPEAMFHKEVLDEKHNRMMIEDVFAEKFQRRVQVEFRIVDTVTTHEESPLVKSTLEKFSGKVVSKWHREGGA